MNRRPLNLQSNALPLSYSRICLIPHPMPFERGVPYRNQRMSSKEELYSSLTEKIIRLNEELIRFSKQAEETQTVIAKASQVTTLYSKL